MQKLTDQYGREVNYLRLSVTDKCNLSCFYCRSDPGKCGIEPVEGALKVKDYLKIGRIAAELGIQRIRLTGGEPLLHPDILKIVNGLANLEGVKDLSLTTNGILLEEMAPRLAKAGLNRVNISLDSLDESNFRQITNGGKLASTLKGIDCSLDEGLKPVKINVVLLKGINEHEIERFVRLTLCRELDVRFIEYMPVGGQHSNWAKYFLPLDKVLEIARTIAPLSVVEGNHGGGPARYCRLEGAVGKIGLISPLSRHFCDRCNRLRVTADGKIKPCLFSDQELDLRPYLDQPAQLKEVFLEALKQKPDPKNSAGNSLERMKQFKGKRPMINIGG
jgi:cyclic pyranopterin phosphate synthase